MAVAQLSDVPTIWEVEAREVLEPRSLRQVLAILQDSIASE